MKIFNQLIAFIIGVCAFALIVSGARTDGLLAFILANLINMNGALQYGKDSN